MLYFCTEALCEHIYYIDELSYLNTCDAILNASNCVQFYNGKLYIDAKDDIAVQALYKINADGSGKELVVENIYIRFVEKLEELENTGTEEIGAVGGSLSWEIYQDKIYVCSSVGGEDGKLQFYVDVYDLNNGEKIDEIAACDFSGNNGMIIDIDIVNDNLKMCMYISSIDLSGDFVDSKEFYNIDLNSGEIKEIAKDATISTYAFYEDKMLYREKNGDIYVVDDIEGQANRCIELTEAEKEYIVSINYVGEYIYITPNIKDQSFLDEYGYYTKVYDKEYKLIDTIKLPGNMRPIAGHNQVLLSVRGGEEMYYFDSAQIGTGEIDIKKYESQ